MAAMINRFKDSIEFGNLLLHVVALQSIDLSLLTIL